MLGKSVQIATLYLISTAICVILVPTFLPLSPSNTTTAASVFDYPVGPPDGNGYYIQQSFENLSGGRYHAAEDWQSVAGGSDSVGAPVFAIANGRVSYANAGANYPGGVVIIEHILPDTTVWYSVYGHLKDVSVSADDDVARGERLGTVLSWPDNVANSHLHFEVRNFYVADPMNGPNADNPRHRNYPPGPGYWPSNPPLHSNERPSTRGWVHPSNFINNHRDASGNCASAPTLLSPSDGATLNSRSVTFDWQAPNCSGVTGYTLHVTTGSGPEDGIIFDYGVGPTEHQYSFPNDGTFYWHVAAWANGQRGPWSSRRIVIDTSQPPPSDGIELVSVPNYTVAPNQQFTAQVTVQVTSGQLREDRGDHLHATPESSDNTFGAWPAQPVQGVVNPGGTFTFHLDMTAPGTSGNYTSVWQMRVEGNHIGPQVRISIQVQSEGDPPSGDEGVYLCRNTGYNDCGRFASDIPSLGNAGFGNDDAESIRIRGDWSTILYMDDNYGGQREVFDGSDSDLNDNTVGRNQASSLRVRRRQPALVSLFSLGDYNGQRWTTDRDIHDLEHWGFNDRTESVCVESGYEAVFFRGAGYHGTYGRTDHCVADANAVAQGLRDNVSSIRICSNLCPPSASTPTLAGPGHRVTLLLSDTVTMSWFGDGTEYMVEYWGGAYGSSRRRSGWRQTTTWEVDLPPHPQPYNWRVRASNGYGESGWSETHSFWLSPTQIKRGLSLSQTNPVVDRSVTAAVTVKNVSNQSVTLRRLGAAGRGPNCADWACSPVKDFPFDQNFTLQPGQEHHYRHDRVFREPGGGYFVQLIYTDADGEWHFIGNRVDFSVVLGLQVIQTLSLSPATPSVGETVTAQFKVKNVSNQTLTFHRLLAGGRGPDCADWSCTAVADFPHDMDVTLSPDEVYHYQRQRTFTQANSDYFVEPVYETPGEVWRMGIFGGNRVAFSVAEACYVDIHAVQEVAGSWHQHSGTYDCTGDGFITVEDIMCWVKRWGDPCP